MCLSKLTHLLAALCCLLLTTALAAQSATCAVVDEDGRPVPYVTVYSPATQKGTITDLEGGFNLDDKFADADTLRLSCLSYADAYVSAVDLRGKSDCRVVLRSDAIELQDIVVTSMVDHTYYAELRIRMPDGELLAVDSRPSDAISLAVHHEPILPIYVSQDVLDSVA